MEPSAGPRGPLSRNVKRVACPDIPDRGQIEVKNS
jgi:hypothetical protein